MTDRKSDMELKNFINFYGIHCKCLNNNVYLAIFGEFMLIQQQQPNREGKSSMRRRIAGNIGFLLILLTMVSCTSYIPFSYKGYDNKTQYSTNIGSTMIYRESGYKKATAPDTGRTTDPLQINTIHHGSRYELIYAGINHNVIQILYREYVVRINQGYYEPVFSQIFQYDINENKSITFQNYKIQVFEANSELIRFQVLSD